MEEYSWIIFLDHISMGKSLKETNNTGMDEEEGEEVGDELYRNKGPLLRGKGALAQWRKLDDERGRRRKRRRRGQSYALLERSRQAT